MKNGFIHIGLPKCASTSLQAIFSSYSHCSFSYGGLVGLIGSARKECKTGEKSDFSITLDRASGDSVILSHESLSCPDIGGYTKDEVISYRKIIKKYLGNQKTLIVIREPEAWVKSMYNQYVKQGGVLDFLCYLYENEQFLIEAYNPKALLDLWDGLLLPSELLRDDPVKFQDLVSSYTGVPVYEYVKASGNHSLKGDYLDYMLTCNRNNRECDINARFALRTWLESKPVLPKTKLSRSNVDSQPIWFLDELRNNIAGIDLHGYEKAYN